MTHFIDFLEAAIGTVVGVLLVVAFSPVLFVLFALFALIWCVFALALLGAFVFVGVRGVWYWFFPAEDAPKSPLERVEPVVGTPPTPRPPTATVSPEIALK